MAEAVGNSSSALQTGEDAYPKEWKIWCFRVAVLNTIQYLIGDQCDAESDCVAECNFLLVRYVVSK